jgi:hypothetical protein
MRRSLFLTLLGLTLTVTACGGSTASESQAPPAPETPAPGTPANPGDPSTPPRTPAKVGQPVAPPNVAVPFQLLVSNQSFDLDPVDIDVYIDGVHVVAGDFVVGSQHTWVPFDFDIATGEHALRVVTKKGGTDASQTFTVNATKRWSVVNFWFYKTAQGGQPADKPHFSIDLFDTQPAFD